MYLCYQDISLDCPDTDAANDLGKEGREWARRKHWSWSKQATDEVEFKDNEVEEGNIQVEPIGMIKNADFQFLMSLGL